MVMTKPALERAIEEGRIFVHPFDPSCVNSASIDVRLGENFFATDREGRYLNPWDEETVRKCWKGPRKAETVKQVRKDYPCMHWCGKEDGRPGKIEICSQVEHLVKPFSPDQQVIILAPGETILAHTEEFIGGADDRIVPSMQARSSIGRSNVSVCSCAGWGDVGFHSRWTMEIKNRSTQQWTVLPVGFRIAQIVFEEGSDPTPGYQSLTGKYQTGQGQEVIETWTPELMLPQAWKDREMRDLPSQT